MADITRREFLTLSLQGGVGALAQASPFFRDDPVPAPTDLAGAEEAPPDNSPPAGPSACCGDVTSAPLAP